MLLRVRKHAPHAIEHASIVAFALKRLIKPPSPREATGVFRAATGVAAAPQRGANPSFATEELGVGLPPLPEGEGVRGERLYSPPLLSTL